MRDNSPFNSSKNWTDNSDGLILLPVDVDGGRMFQVFAFQWMRLQEVNQSDIKILEL